MIRWKTVRSRAGRKVHLASTTLLERVARRLPGGNAACLPVGRLGVVFVDCDGPVTCVSCLNMIKEEGDGTGDVDASDGSVVRGRGKWFRGV